MTSFTCRTLCRLCIYKNIFIFFQNNLKVLMIFQTWLIDNENKERAIVEFRLCYILKISIKWGVMFFETIGVSKRIAFYLFFILEDISTAVKSSWLMPHPKQGIIFSRRTSSSFFLCRQVKDFFLFFSEPPWLVQNCLSASLETGPSFILCLNLFCVNEWQCIGNWKEKEENLCCKNL